MGKTPTLEEARALLAEYNSEPFHLKHGEIVSGVLGVFAEEFDPGRVGFWQVAGMLHDLDFERWPEEHCLKAQEMMTEMGFDQELIHAVVSHGFGLTVDVEPACQMERILYAVDELTGLIGACALMRPSRSVMDMEPKSVKKKYKNANFAAGCSREVIGRGAEMLGWELDELIARTLAAMQQVGDI